MKNSIYFRIFIATALIVLFSISILGGLSTALSYRRTMTDKRDMMISTLHETSRYIITQHFHYSVNLDDLNLRMWLSMTSGLTGFDLFVTNADGRIESCSERGFTNLGKYVPEYILSVVDLRDSKIVMSSLGQIYPERRQISAFPLAMNIDDELRVFGYLFVTSDISAFRQEWRDFYSALILIAVSVMFLAFIVSYLATKKQAEPLNEMANVARRFARGEFSARVKYRGGSAKGGASNKDEIGQLTEAFNAMADTLESSERLRRDFIESLSHEFKTPMTVISGFAEGLLDGTIPRDSEAKYLGIISSETRRLSRLVRSMTEISTLQSDESSMVYNSSFDVSEVVRLALISFDGKLENKQLSVDAVLPDEAIITRGDADSITRVVYNLIDNAIKFSVPAGVIGLELWQQDTRVFVSVTNHGDDIPNKELPHIFDRFHKGDKSRSADRDGVGLGLFIVKKILDNHNEDIFVTSSGGITKFIFSLTIV
ncbi:MAG: HAMP domain-containing histidine kinase [Oscillospiraceae bacterium]|jgi:signal transduction histidine kinase|nr:HAMP domain-containing histidine kinase [Oscillospiraceae bacterium]